MLLYPVFAVVVPVGPVENRVFGFPQANRQSPFSFESFSSFFLFAVL